VVRTTDGGATWSRQRGGAGTGAPQRLQHVFFIDDQYGYAAGEQGTLVFTSTGGATWGTRYVCGPQPAGKRTSIIITSPWG
jgi:photosystem II stability/assembly factor-like uncharacterized protein